MANHGIEPVREGDRGESTRRAAAGVRVDEDAGGTGRGNATRERTAHE